MTPTNKSGNDVANAMTINETANSLNFKNLDIRNNRVTIIAPLRVRSSIEIIKIVIDTIGDKINSKY
ncbi:MAG: hypothetical protein A3B96_00805 [Candidatus Spechtbacteria bacterium RIFCSPHIGHO2_02_FULL_43_15b]|uniref:Uncharacterized protein n=1 Tax=Candidatus Spechtbacteria bacterium RIFCSPHIGHO2_01_FULL_43_30 TaxID=1802158 RepID=A0A1G2H5F7_9BACT|nr:MAG: hypothetical protein A2827_01200 [Candidatus Spechtbacteria bacterium RIFCSPHIGHO2_01_FULL_43_30]OGZ59840.1 MAG: hypothetical protein A3B96_00805 [Candidatus Spechtbacteria bacterium RIFCSPHIGHO2_02_FULL_43_15b]